MELRFVPSESAFTYFEALKGYLETHGRPIAFYSDRHSIFRVPRKDAKGGQGMTQFGRALAELNIEILCASSSQAKGRVERVNRTLQDRLVKELRMAGVSSIEAGNAFLPDFIARFNARFAVAPARPNDLHRPLNIPPERLRMILCRREQWAQQEHGRRHRQTTSSRSVRQDRPTGDLAATTGTLALPQPGRDRRPGAGPA